MTKRSRALTPLHAAAVSVCTGATKQPDDPAAPGAGGRTVRRGLSKRDNATSAEG
jgi:hypothetical protein